MRWSPPLHSLYELVYTPYGVFNCSRGLQVRPTMTVPCVTCAPSNASPAWRGHICKHHAMLIHMQFELSGHGLVSTMHGIFWLLDGAAGVDLSGTLCTTLALQLMAG